MSDWSGWVLLIVGIYALVFTGLDIAGVVDIGWGPR